MQPVYVRNVEDGSIVFGKVSRVLVSASVLAIIAGCSTSGEGPTARDRSRVKPVVPAAGAGPTGDIVEGSCPVVVLRDGTAFLRTYARGGQDDPQKVVYQASLADTTRNCTINESTLNITVMAQGRLVLGPEGAPGRYKLPIRVAVVDNQTTLYSELTQFEVEVPAGSSSTQFLFTKANVAIPGGAGRQAKVFLGFDEGPYNTK